MKALAADPVAHNQQNERVTRRSAALNFATWFLPALILCIVLARGAVHVQSLWAPLGVFPLLVGAALGAVVVGLTLLAAPQQRGTLLAGTLLLTFVTVISEHYFFFRIETLNRHAALEVAKAKNPAARAVQMPPPELGPAAFVQFIKSRAEPSRVAFWAVDALLVALAATLTVSFGARRNLSADRRSPPAEVT